MTSTTTTSSSAELPRRRRRSSSSSSSLLFSPQDYLREAGGGRCDNYGYHHPNDDDDDDNNNDDDDDDDLQLVSAANTPQKGMVVLAAAAAAPLAVVDGPTTTTTTAVFTTPRSSSLFSPSATSTTTKSNNHYHHREVVNQLLSPFSPLMARRQQQQQRHGEIKEQQDVPQEQDKQDEDEQQQQRNDYRQMLSLQPCRKVSIVVRVLPMDDDRDDYDNEKDDDDDKDGVESNVNDDNYGNSKTSVEWQRVVFPHYKEPPLASSTTAAAAAAAAPPFFSPSILGGSSDGASPGFMTTTMMTPSPPSPLQRQQGRHGGTNGTSGRHGRSSPTSVRDVIVVNPSAFGRNIPTRLTMETAKLVSKVARVDSEDWARLYEFHHVVWPTTTTTTKNSTEGTTKASTPKSNPSDPYQFNTMDSLSRAVALDALTDHASSLVISLGQRPSALSEGGGGGGGGGTTAAGGENKNRQNKNEEGNLLLWPKIITECQALQDEKTVITVSMVEVVEDSTISTASGNGAARFRDLLKDDHHPRNNNKNNLALRHTDMKGAVLQGLTEVAIDDVPALWESVVNKKRRRQRQRQAGRRSDSSSTSTNQNNDHHHEDDGTAVVATVNVWDNGVAHKLKRPPSAQITVVELATSTTSSNSFIQHRKGAVSLGQALRQLLLQSSAANNSSQIRGSATPAKGDGQHQPQQQQQLPPTQIPLPAVSFRETTLTKVLQRSMESSKIVLVASVSPLAKDYHSTIATLNYLRRLLVKPGKTASSPFKTTDENAVNISGVTTTMTTPSPHAGLKTPTPLPASRHGSTPHSSTHGPTPTGAKPPTPSPLPLAPEDGALIQELAHSDGMLEALVADPRQRLAKLIQSSPPRRKQQFPSLDYYEGEADEGENDDNDDRYELPAFDDHHGKDGSANERLDKDDERSTFPSPRTMLKVVEKTPKKNYGEDMATISRVDNEWYTEEEIRRDLGGDGMDHVPIQLYPDEEEDDNKDEDEALSFHDNSGQGGAADPLTERIAGIPNSMADPLNPTANAAHEDDKEQYDDSHPTEQNLEVSRNDQDPKLFTDTSTESLEPTTEEQDIHQMTFQNGLPSGLDQNSISFQRHQESTIEIFDSRGPDTDVDVVDFSEEEAVGGWSQLYDEDDDISLGLEPDENAFAQESAVNKIMQDSTLLNQGQISFAHENEFDDVGDVGDSYIDYELPEETLSFQLSTATQEGNAKPLNSSRRVEGIATKVTRQSITTQKLQLATERTQQISSTEPYESTQAHSFFSTQTGTQDNENTGEYESHLVHQLRQELEDLRDQLDEEVEERLRADKTKEATLSAFEELRMEHQNLLEEVATGQSWTNNALELRTQSEQHASQLEVVIRNMKDEQRGLEEDRDTLRVKNKALESKLRHEKVSLQQERESVEQWKSRHEKNLLEDAQTIEKLQAELSSRDLAMVELQQLRDQLERAKQDQDKLSTVNTRNLELSNVLSEREKDLLDSNTRLRKLEDELAEYQNGLASSSRGTKAMEADLQLLRDKETRLTRSLQAKDEALERLQSKYEQLEASHEADRVTLLRLESDMRIKGAAFDDLDALQGELSRTKEDKSNLEQLVSEREADLREIIKKLDEERLAWNSKIAQSQKELKEVRIELVSLQKEKGTAVAERRQYRDKTADLEKQLASAKTELSRIRSDYQTLQSTRGQEHESTRQLATQLALRGDALDEAEQKLSRLQSDNHHMKTLMTTVRAEYEDTMADSAQKVAEYIVAIETLKHELEEAKRALGNFEAEASSKVRSLQESEATLTELLKHREQEIEELWLKLQAAREEASESRQRETSQQARSEMQITVLQKQMDELQLDLESAKREIAESHRRAQSHSRSYEAVLTELQEAKDDASRRQQTIGRLTKELGERQAESQSKDEKILRCQSQLRRFQDEARTRTTSVMESSIRQTQDMARTVRRLEELVQRLQGERDACYDALEAGRRRLVNLSQSGRHFAWDPEDVLQLPPPPTSEFGSPRGTNSSGRRRRRSDNFVSAYEAGEVADDTPNRDRGHSLRAEEIASCVAVNAQASLQEKEDEKLKLQAKIYHFDEAKRIETDALKAKIRSLEGELGRS